MHPIRRTVSVPLLYLYFALTAASLLLPVTGYSNCLIQPGNKYITQKGDTLGLIGLRCFGSVKKGLELGELNQIRNPNHLKMGAVLQLPQDVAMIDEQTSAELELAFWRKRFRLSGPTTGVQVTQKKTKPVSEIKSTQELAVIDAAKAQAPEEGLQATRTLLKEEPTLVSARIAEIKLLIRTGRKAEAEMRARALIGAHPELKEVPKIREWANLSEQRQQTPAPNSVEEFAQ